MDKVVRFSAAQRRELFSEAAARLGMTPAVVEKDFWVTWVLDRLFAAPDLARLLMFKGGISLSKVYGLIERFSEDTYLRPDVRLEIGPLAAWLPHEEGRITAYAAEAFPDLFARKETTVRTIRAERTFWEKATILHQEAHRPEGNPQPARYSRHYYDLARMAASPVKAAALADRELLASVVAFKQRFYPRTWARYDLAAPGSLRLLPGERGLSAVKADYRAMADMIFGRIPDFAEIVAQLRSLEKEINAGTARPPA